MLRYLLNLLACGLAILATVYATAVALLSIGA